MWKQTYEKQRKQPTAVRHSIVQQWQREAERDNSWKQWRAWQRSQTVKLVLWQSPPYLRKIWNSWKIQQVQESRETGLVYVLYLQIQLESKWGQIQGAQKCVSMMSVMCIQIGWGAQTSSALHSFSLHNVLRSCKSTSGSRGRDLTLFWLRRDVRVRGLWTILIADSERKKNQNI